MRRMASRAGSRTGHLQGPSDMDWTRALCSLEDQVRGVTRTPVDRGGLDEEAHRPFRPTIRKSTAQNMVSFGLPGEGGLPNKSPCSNLRVKLLSTEISYHRSYNPSKQLTLWPRT